MPKSKSKSKSPKKRPPRRFKKRRCRALVPDGQCPAPVFPGSFYCTQHLRETLHHKKQVAARIAEKNAARKHAREPNIIFNVPKDMENLPPGEYAFRITQCQNTRGGLTIDGSLIRCRRCSKPAVAGRTCCAEHITEKNAEMRAQYSDTGAGVWTKRDGSIIPINRLSDSHLANIVAMLVRRLGMLTSEAARRAREAKEEDQENLAPSPSGWEEGVE